MERKPYLDILKGLSIIFVLFVHVCRDLSVYDYLFGFCMVPFFYVSGAVFNRDKYDGFKSFLKSRIKSLIIPYVPFYLLTYLYWLFIESRFRGADYTPLEQITGLFYGTYNVRYNNFNGALWFLPALFSMEIIYWFVSKIKNKYIEWGLMATLYLLFFFFNPILHKLPWSLFEAVIALSFFAIGNVLSAKTEQLGWKVIVPAMVVSLIVQLMLQGNTLAAWRVDETSTNPLYSYLLPLAGLVFYVGLSLLIKRNRLLEWIGRNSLIIFAFHASVMRILIAVLANLTHMQVADFRNSIPLSMLTVGLIIVVLLPLCFAWNKWINPFIRKAF